MLKLQFRASKCNTSDFGDLAPCNSVWLQISRIWLHAVLHDPKFRGFDSMHWCLASNFEDLASCITVCFQISRIWLQKNNIINREPIHHSLFFANHPTNGAIDARKKTNLCQSQLSMTMICKTCNSWSHQPIHLHQSRKRDANVREHPFLNALMCL